MAIFAPFLIWLAKVLIQHFLNTSLELKKELESSVKRVEDHEKQLAELRKRELAFEKDIDAKNRYLTDLYFDITTLNRKIEEKQKEHADKLHEIEERISNTSDTDIIRHEL